MGTRKAQPAEQPPIQPQENGTPAADSQKPEEDRVERIRVNAQRELDILKEAAKPAPVEAETGFYERSDPRDK